MEENLIIDGEASYRTADEWVAVAEVAIPGEGGAFGLLQPVPARAQQGLDIGEQQRGNGARGQRAAQALGPGNGLRVVQVAALVGQQRNGTVGAIGLRGDANELAAFEGGAHGGQCVEMDWRS